jgi:hypothetical protein
MSVFQRLLGIEPQQAGGVLGQVMQAQPQQGFAPQTQMQQKPKFWQTPEFASTLTRLGANLAAASSQNEDFLTGLSLATAQTAKDTEAARAQGMQNQLIQAQINKANAEAAPQLPFSGTGFENQVAGTYYNAYLAQGLSPMEAQIKAAQAVFNREPTYIQGPEGPVPVAGRQLPSLSSQLQAQPSVEPSFAQPQVNFVQPQGDVIDQAAANLGLPAGTLKPYASGTEPQGAMPTQGVLSAPVVSDTAMPSGGGMPAPQGGAFPRGNLIQPRVGVGPKTDQATIQAANEAEIGVQGRFAEQLADIEANRLKGLRENASSLNERAPDMERLALALERYGDTGTFGDFRLFINKLASDAGIADADRVAEGELASKIVSKITPSLRPTGSGSASDKDMAIFFDSLPNLMTTRKGARTSYQYFERVRQYQNAIANEAENFAYNNRTMRGFNEHLDKLKKDGVISLWNEDERKQLQAIAKGTSIQNAGMPQPKNKSEFDALPSGEQFLDPNGDLRRKP